MVRKHIKRDYSSHRKSVVRPSQEYCKLEIFSFDPSETIYYSVYEGNVTGENISETNCYSWRCLESADNTVRLKVNCRYLAVEDGEYRIDILYQCKDDRDMTGFIRTYKEGVQLKEDTHLFDGESNVVKRLTTFHQLDQGDYTFNLRLPVNCYFLGCIIRKIVYFSGDSIDSAGTNLLFSKASLTQSSQVKPREASVTIGYDDSFECGESPSGFYMDYHNEMNIYVKDDDDNLKQIFGGYISSILPDSDRTTLTITGADRLIDGQNKYVMDSMYLLGGTKEVDDYDADLYHDFKNYGEALKYLCDIYEITLKNNINENYLVAGESYESGLAITFGTNGNAKNVHANNCTISENQNFITLRNNPSSEEYQSVYCYDVNDYNIEPVDITNYPNFYVTYGLGDPKTEYDTVNTDSTNETSVSSSFNKYGVSSDKTQIMAIGRPSAPAELNKYGYKFYKTVFKRKCPACGSTELYWGIFWAGNETSNYGKFPATGRNEGGSAEGHIFCKSCDADFSTIEGKDHTNPPRFRLTTIKSPVSSSKDEAYLLKSGKFGKGNSGSTATPEGVFTDITNEAFKYRYNLGGCSSFSCMKSSGSGDCWAFSDLIFTRLKERGVGCQIRQYPTSASSRHRSVLYKNSSGQYVDFPYREYGWGSKYNNMLNNTSSSTNGTIISSYDGNGIDTASLGVSDNKKITMGYDKDNVFKGYFEIVFSTDKVNTNSLVFDFTLNGRHQNTIGEITPYLINNVVKQGSLNVLELMRELMDDEDSYRYYIHAIKIKSDIRIDPWYKTDNNTVDESSCKLDLYGMGFNEGTIVNPSDLSSCGKSIISQIETLVKQSGYLVDMDYGVHRKDDVINFKVDNQVTPSFIAMEGDDNNILSWGSITYSPINSLFNTSVQVYKKEHETGMYYAFVNTKDSNSVLEYGEQTTLQSTSEVLSDKEAYYYSRKKNDKFNSKETYSYSITVPEAPDIDLGDLVKVVADAKKLNTIKRVESLKINYDNSKIPRIQTELGLGELSDDLLLQRTLRELRESAKKESTLFSTTAQGVTDSEVYQWEV